MSLGTNTLIAQEAKKMNTQQTLIAFFKAGDIQSADELEKLCHKNFRVIFLDIEKSTSQSINRSDYLNYVKSKVFGGKNRSLSKLNALAEKNIYTFAVISKEKESPEFLHHISMLLENGQWWVVQDLVYIQ